MSVADTLAAVRPRSSRAVAFLVFAVAIALIAATPFLPNYYIRVIDSLLIYILLGIGLNIVIGYTGLLDLGFVAFYAVGAYSYALLASPQLDLHLPFLLILLVPACLPPTQRTRKPTTNASGGSPSKPAATPARALSSHTLASSENTTTS